MGKSSKRRLCSIVVAVFIVCGCLGKESKQVRTLWPPPPAQPRMEFVGTYASKEDFPKGRWRQAMESFLGKTPTETFKAPQGIYAGDSGRVFISDIGARNIIVFDFNRKSVDLLFNRLPFNRPPLDEPLDLAMDKRGNLYVADGKKKKILVFSPEGAPLYAFGDGNLLPSPECLAIDDRNERLYVSDHLAGRIVVFDLKGKHLFSFGRQGSDEGEFDEPHGLAIDAENRVFVADTGNARIQVFDGDGKFLYQFGEHGNRVWHFKKPIDLAFDSEGHLYVLDQEMLALFTYDPGGEVLLSTGTGKPSKRQLGLLMPTSIHIDNKDRIYIADQRNKRFTVWQYLSSQSLQENPPSAADLRKLKEHVEERQKQSPG